MAQKRLYTEADVAALGRGAVLVLGKQALATPAALDMAFRRGVIVRYGEGDDAARAPGAATGVFERMLASDGTYVVTVQQGNAVVARLEAGVPVVFGSHPASK